MALTKEDINVTRMLVKGLTTRFGIASRIEYLRRALSLLDSLENEPDEARQVELINEELECLEQCEFLYLYLASLASKAKATPESPFAVFLENEEV